MEEPQWLTSLNQNQRRAVEHPSRGGLQILAGPGSGKTRVLTCRVAYLLKQCGVPPDGLVAVTFTNKAANEMKNRLITLLGDSLAAQVILGTFHGMCVVFLRKYGTKIGLKSNWLICDRDQQLQYCKSILKDAQFSGQLQQDNLSMKPNTLLDSISKAKSKTLSPEALLQQAENSYQRLIASMFRRYVDLLQADNCLDFDDLLLFGEKLFRSHPAVIAHIQHVLIDEFQDTNTVQYQIMTLLAHRGAVTVVGDPDQGIYGFRNAQAINLDKMTNDFSNTQVILLEENYRSSLSILKASLAVVRQDQGRIDKDLHTTHPRVSLPTLRSFENPQEEAAFIAQEIHRLIAHTGSQLNYNDFCILMRYNALSRNLEAALKIGGIPVRMIGAQKFFERTEVKDVLAYLQLADNPTFAPAFERVINTPKRSIGQVTINAIKAAARTHHISPLEVLLKVVRGKDFPGLKSAQTATFKKFLSVICNIQKMAQEKLPVADIIDSLLEQTKYADYLQKIHGPEAVQRDQNIQELKAFATHLAEESPVLSAEPTSLTKESSDSLPKPNSRSAVSFHGLDRLESVINQTSVDPEEMTPLRHFLIQSSLSTDADAEASKDDKNQPRVTICTCHSSKGLEWPVVFVVAVEDGIFPFYLCNEPEEVKEERRLLFVAMTRAQGILYLTHSATRMQGAEAHEQEVSIFLRKLISRQYKGGRSSPDDLFTMDFPLLDQTMRSELSAVIKRQTATESDVKRTIQEYHAKPRKTFRIPSRHEQNFFNQRDKCQPNFNRWGEDRVHSSSLGRFSSTIPQPGPHGSFQGKFRSLASTPAIPYSQQATGALKVFAQPIRVPPEPKKQFKTSTLHQPFVPPKLSKCTKIEHIHQKMEPFDSSIGPSQPSLGNQRLDKLKIMSNTFLSDLKNDIPEDLPQEKQVSNLIEHRANRIGSDQLPNSKPHNKRAGAAGFSRADKKIKMEPETG